MLWGARGAKLDAPSLLVVWFVMNDRAKANRTAYHVRVKDGDMGRGSASTACRHGGSTLCWVRTHTLERREHRLGRRPD